MHFDFSYVCFTYNTVLQIKNSTRNLNTLITENMDGKPALPEGSHTTLTQTGTWHCQQKELEYKGGQRQVHDACIVQYVLQLEKDTFQDEAMSNSEEIKPIAT